MSEAVAEDRGREIWIEKYRPDTLEEIVGHDEITERLREYISQDDLPHLLFAGPAGTGKCVTGETPVLTARGLKRIDEVVGDVEGFGEPDGGTEIVTYDERSGFERTAPSDVFGKRAENLLKVTTRDGGESTMTPEHRLLVVTESGLDWKRAEELEKGDRIARPLRVPLPERNEEIEWTESLDEERTLVHLTGEFAEKRSVSESESHIGERTAVCSLSELRSLDVSRAELRDHVAAIQHVTPNGRRSPPTDVPWELTPALASLLGLAVSGARITSGRIRFHNADAELLGRFESAMIESFGIEPTRGKQKGVPYCEVNNRAVVHYLRRCFDAFGDGIGSRLVQAEPESRRAFLRAVFDAEGDVTEEGTVELTQRDPKTITLLSYLLAGEEIPSRRNRSRRSAADGSDESRECHTLYVSGAAALSTFEETVGFTDEEKARRLAANADEESNHNTIPVQSAVSELCGTLYLEEAELLTTTSDPERERKSYLDDVEGVVAAATERIEAAQEVLEGIDRLAETVSRTDAIPATRGERSDREPVSARTSVGTGTGVRTDRSLEYADGIETQSDVATIQSELRTAVERLNVPYNRVAEGTDLCGADVIELLENDDHRLSTDSRFETVSERIRDVAAEMLTEPVIEALHTLDTLARGDLYFDEVETVERVEEPRRVYDLTVPGTRNYVAGSVPTVMHNTTSALAIAREIYGDDWRENFLELNASDQRGIDVVRDRIKQFARASFGGYDHRIIFLDEADALTSDAQSALRRTMEQFSDNTRFILSCNYSSQIIDPIQSRCAVFRFSPLGDEAIEEQISRIAEAEEIETTDDGVEALVYAAGGDMRKAINGLQAAAVMGETVDEEAVYAITSTARPEEIREMVTKALDGDFTAARAKLDALLTEAGIAGGDIIDQLHRSVWEFDLDDREAVRVMERVGEADYRITAGANEQVQLEALLASLALEE